MRMSLVEGPVTDSLPKDREVTTRAAFGARLLAKDVAVDRSGPSAMSARHTIATGTTTSAHKSKGSAFLRWPFSVSTAGSGCRIADWLKRGSTAGRYRPFGTVITPGSSLPS